MINYNAFDLEGMPSEEEFTGHDGECDDEDLCPKCLAWERYWSFQEDVAEERGWDED